MNRQLTAEAEERIASFESRWLGYGCRCFTGCAPCGRCTDPDNPMNVYEEDEAWEKEPEPIDLMAAVRAVCEGGAA